jgi:hypothetical protein
VELPIRLLYNVVNKLNDLESLIVISSMMDIINMVDSLADNKCNDSILNLAIPGEPLNEGV